jgi:transposase-like protein
MVQKIESVKINSVETRYDGTRHTVRTDEEKKRIVDEIIELDCKKGEILELFNIHPSQFYTWRSIFYGSHKKPHKPVGYWSNHSPNKRKSFSEETKINIVKSIINTKCSKDDIHKVHGIHVGTFYNWKNKYFPNGYPETDKKVEIKKVGQMSNLVIQLPIPFDDVEFFHKENKHEIDKIVKSIGDLYEKWKESDTISHIKSKLSDDIIFGITTKVGITRSELINFIKA